MVLHCSRICRFVAFFCTSSSSGVMRLDLPVECSAHLAQIAYVSQIAYVPDSPHSPDSPHGLPDLCILYQPGILIPMRPMHLMRLMRLTHIVLTVQMNRIN